MWKRTEFRYETMMSMAMFVEAGIWKIRDAFARKTAPLNGFIKTRREKGQQTFAKLETPFQLSEGNLSEVKEQVSQLVAGFLMMVSNCPS